MLSIDRRIAIVLYLFIMQQILISKKKKRKHEVNKMIKELHVQVGKGNVMISAF